MITYWRSQVSILMYSTDIPLYHRYTFLTEDQQLLQSYRDSALSLISFELNLTLHNSWIFYIICRTCIQNCKIEFLKDLFLFNLVNMTNCSILTISAFFKCGFVSEINVNIIFHLQRLFDHVHQQTTSGKERLHGKTLKTSLTSVINIFITVF